jgi:hypothetical protein
MDPVEARVGLCATCRFHRIITGARSAFYLCEKSFTDPRFRRYPPLPVVKCDGYEPLERRSGAGASPSPGPTDDEPNERK